MAEMHKSTDPSVAAGAPRDARWRVLLPAFSDNEQTGEITAISDGSGDALVACTCNRSLANNTSKNS
jgi:hypothetical protein